MTPFPKKPTLDFDRFEESRNKRLDNLEKAGYNIRTRVVDTEIEVVDPFDITRNRTRSTKNINDLSGIYEKILEAHKASESEGPPPVIAGGAVRDTLLGLLYKDIDVFSFVPEGDLDDENVYFTSFLRAGLGVKSPFHDVGRQYAHSDFSTYRSVSYLGIIDSMTTRRTSPEELIEGFDHDLVRCYYDGEFKVSKAFLKTIKKGRVESTSARAWNRLSNWRLRTGYDIVIGRPQKSRSQSTLSDRALNSFLSF